jgi:hypothetical protein
LLTHGVTDPNMPDFKGNSPLKVARETENPELIDLLTQHEAKD